MASSAKVATRVAIVTGGNKGIGFEICRAVGSLDGWVCVLGSRSEERGRAAVAALEKAGVANVKLAQLDIGDSDSVKRFAAHVAKTYGAVDCIVNNAAIAFKGADPTPFQKQARPTLETNLFATVAFTNAMRPLLRKPVSGARRARIVNVASQAGSGALSRMSQARQKQLMSTDTTEKQLLGLGRDFIQAVEAGTHASNGWPNTCYGTSKALVIAWTFFLAREGKKAGFESASCCPGYCATDMSSHRGPRSAAKGAETPAWLATRDTPLDGRFYYDKKPIATNRGTAA